MKNNTKLSSSTSITKDNNYEYSIGNGQVTLTKYLGTDSQLIIPEVIDGFPVTTIGSDCFLNNLVLNSVSLSSVVHICTNAFCGCTSLTTVTGYNVSAIYYYGFYNCHSLKSIIIPKVEFLDLYTFANCKSLETISMPLLIGLPPYLFSNCYALKSVDIPLVKTIGYFAFKNCKSLEKINSPDLLYIDYGAFCYSGIKSVNFQKVLTVNHDAFLGCTTLEKVSLPSATTINSGAFMDSSIIELDLPNITCLGNKAFYLCTALQTICLSKKLTEIGSEVFTLSPINSLTMDYGKGDIFSITVDVWFEFANKLTGINIDNIKARYIKNNLYYIDFSIEDAEPPIITLNGDNPMTLEVGLSIYDEQGATITDKSGDVIPLAISGYVDTSKIGEYIINYSATDPLGNKAETIRTVNVIDTTPPIITLNGDNPMTIEVGLSTYDEPGCTVTDNSSENIVPVISGDVDTNKVGEYIVTYSATDSSGNKAETTRTISIIDTIPPIITLNGDKLMTLEVGLSTYIEQGATVTDKSGEILEVLILGSVNTNKIGSYTLTYSANDSSINMSQAMRTVNVIDTTSPIITLNGDNPMTIEVGLSPYDEPGCTVTDNSGESIIPSITGSVDINTVGEYTLVYCATDSSNNLSKAKRTVYVIEPMASESPINENYIMETVINSQYIDADTTTMDNSNEEIDNIITGVLDTSEYESADLVSDYTINCSKIVAYNNKSKTVKWAIFTLDNNVIYISRNCMYCQEWSLNLDILDLPSGTKLYLKAIIEGNEEPADKIIEYIPNTSTTYFELHENLSKTTLKYNGILYSYD